MCTNLELLIYEEPCLMCGMAMVLSKIYRVYIGRCDYAEGAYSKHKLSVIKRLNHHAEVIVVDV